ncbi:MAG: hypothetical protein SFZ24_11080 [Planctomycetota bacterium]|nr:hypothetical protein [Planctomycetota bacterium]
MMSAALLVAQAGAGAMTAGAWLVAQAGATAGGGWLLAADVLGWAGMIMLLGAFALGIERLGARRYYAANALGAALVAVVCLARETWPALALEVVWASVAAVNLARKWRAGG